MLIRIFLFSWVTIFVATIDVLPAQAAEKINQFDVVIDVQADGDIVVTETINVTVEGLNIKRGIFRDLPRFFEVDGARIPYRYKVLSVKRNGEEENYKRENVQNALRIRIGDADILLPRGKHIYEIRYQVKNQIRYFDDYDELYWNVTGTYWRFSIDKASATITFPGGARAFQHAAYTGYRGAAGTDFLYRFADGAHIFETTRPLQVQEGLTIAVGVAKGVIDPLSVADNRYLWWQRNGALTVLVLSFFGVLGFYYRSFDEVGRDPKKGPVIVRYAPPEGYSPAAVHYIYHRGFSGNRAIVATLLNMATKGYLTIGAKTKKSTSITAMRESGDRNLKPLRDGYAEEAILDRHLFRSVKSLNLDGDYNKDLSRANESFQEDISTRFGSDYFKWNFGYVFLAATASLIAIIFAALAFHSWSQWHTFALIGIALVNGLFMYLMPAPSRYGQKIRTEIEGFKLYLETAEKLHLNAVEVGSDDAPPMTVERYEKFLSYAVALKVEKPWTQHFEKLLPKKAAAYQPHWAHGSFIEHRSFHQISSSLVSGLDSGVSSAIPQPSSSSGSGGGGFSGGGGGGGGGGGW